MSLKAFVVDDTILFRTIVADALKSIPDVEVIGTAASGRLALSKIEELKPDLVTLDIEMPGMDGLQVLEEMKKKGLKSGVIIVSSLTVQGSSYTIQALEKGAFDFINKPSEGNAEQNRKAVREALVPRVQAFARSHEISKILKGKQNAANTINLTDKKVPTSIQIKNTTVHSKASNSLKNTKTELILIGVSTGGPAALTTLLPSIAENIGVPILIVQHMPPLFTKALAESLNNKCKIKVYEASNGDILKPGVAYIAPGGKQMKISLNTTQNEKIITITDDPPENNCKPAVDYMFRSAANNFPGKSIGVILTGMGSDGTIGLKLLKRHGCYVIAQDESSCVVYGMPKAAADAGIVDDILPLNQIAQKLNDAVRKGIW